MGSVTIDIAQETDSKGQMALMIEDLEELGFVNTFKVDGQTLVCNETGEKFFPAQLRLHGAHRFEGMSDPGDNRVVYAIEGPHETRGVLIDAYGVYCDPHIAAIIEAVPDARAA